MFARRGGHKLPSGRWGAWGHIGICNAYNPDAGEKMYGKGNFVILNDVLSSLSILTAFLRQISVRQ